MSNYLICLEFDHGCLSYLGPHTETCQTTLWLQAGCILEGQLAPACLSVSENSTLNALTLR